MFRLTLRNLAHTFRRYPLPTIINLAGFTAALVAFITISSHIAFELGYDRSYPTAGRIFRVDCPDNEATFRSILPNAFGRDIIASSAHIEAGTLLMPYMGEMTFYADDESGQTHGYELQCDLVQPGFLKVFGVEITAGSDEVLDTPGSVMIPESMARRIFSSDPIGKTLHVEKSWFFPDGQVTVGAVYKDFPENSNLRNSIYLAIDERTMPYTYGAANFICYLLLDSPDSAAEVEDTFNSSFDFSLSWMSPIKLVPMEDIYFLGQGGDGRVFRSGNRHTSMLLAAIGLLVLLSGAINFANFFTSLAPVRIRSINIQKISGASDAGLRFMLTMETVLISIFCLLVALLLSGWISRAMEAANMLDGEFSISNAKVTLTAAAVTLVTGILAGLYPAHYATSFAPAMVLKGDFGLSGGGRMFRKAMSGIQYTVAFVTLIFSMFIVLQNAHVRKSELGFDKDRLAVAEIPASVEKKIDMLRSKAGSCPSIEGMALSSEKVGAQDTYSTSGIEIDGNNISTFVIGIDPEFLDVMGIRMVEGRGFNIYDSTGTAVIASRYFLDHYGIKEGDNIPWRGKVIGICDDVRFNSLRNDSKPVLFIPASTYASNGNLWFRLKDGCDRKEAEAEIRSLILEADPYWPGQIEFFNDLQEKLYSSELRTSRLVSVFSAIAAFLALCGVAGMVIFDSEYRRKETAVRKICGATTFSILRGANLSYGIMTSVCFVIACPVSIFVTSSYMENFADKIPLFFWVFPAAFAAVLVLTAAVVTAIFWRRASANPCEGLK